MKSWSIICLLFLSTILLPGCSTSEVTRDASNLSASSGPHGYLIAQIGIKDFDRFNAEYGQRVMPILMRYGARPVVASPTVELREGVWGGNWTVVMEFPSHAAAAAFYKSSDYQPFIALRKSLSQFGNLALVDGFSSSSSAARDTAGKSYLIARLDVQDFEGFKKGYGDKLGPIFQRAGGRILVASKTVDLREGDWKANWTVVIEFPSHEAAAGFYNSTEYQSLIPVRKSVTRSGTIVFAEGFSMPPAPAGK